MKDDIINKNSHLSLFPNGTDTARRVRFQFQSEQQQSTLPSHLSDHNLRQFEQMYIDRDNILEKITINSTVV